MRLTQRKIKARVSVTDVLEWDPRCRKLTLERRFLGSRRQHWSVTVDGTFDATFNEHGTLHSRPSGGNAALGALLSAPLPGSAVVGAVIGSSVHKTTDTRASWIEVWGEGFHEIVEVRAREDAFSKHPHRDAARIAIAVKKVAVEARR